MSRSRVTQTQLGSWSVWHGDQMDAKATLEQATAGGLRQARFQTIAGIDGYLKASPLRIKSAWRHKAKRCSLTTAYPRVSEWRNLDWLRRHQFVAPRPIAAGVLFEWGLPRAQWLFSERLHGFEDWGTSFSGAGPDDREKWLQALAEEVARMHALGFVHHDLFPRNLMLPAQGQPTPPGFLDAWAGGPGWGLRGATYDLACFASEGLTDCTPAEQQLFWHAYQTGRAQQDRPIRDWSAFAQKIERQRTRLRPRQT